MATTLADKVHAEQQAVAAGTATACGEKHPHDDVETVCVRATHLPEDHVHVGVFGDDGALLQWAEESAEPAPAPADIAAAAAAAAGQASP